MIFIGAMAHAQRHMRQEQQWQHDISCPWVLQAWLWRCLIVEDWLLAVHGCAWLRTISFKVERLPVLDFPFHYAYQIGFNVDVYFIMKARWQTNLQQTKKKEKAHGSERSSGAKSLHKAVNILPEVPHTAFHLLLISQKQSPDCSICERWGFPASVVDGNKKWTGVGRERPRDGPRTGRTSLLSSVHRWDQDYPKSRYWSLVDLGLGTKSYFRILYISTIS